MSVIEWLGNVGIFIGGMGAGYGIGHRHGGASREQLLRLTSWPTRVVAVDPECPRCGVLLNEKDLKCSCGPGVVCPVHGPFSKGR